MTMTRGALAVDLAERVFSGPIAGSLTPRRLGAEVEFIPVEAAHRPALCVCWATGLSPPCLFSGATVADRVGGKAAPPKAPRALPCRPGARSTFEPGGQLEYSSPACRSASSLLALLRSVVLPLRAAAAGEGIDLLAVGIDPLNPAERAPMVIHAHRYERMAEYLGRLGPSGARMMRQTAAFQVSADFDDEPWLRWRVLNAAAPYVVAIFANSPIYAGEPTGHQSARADAWRRLDPARTGIPFDECAPARGVPRVCAGRAGYPVSYAERRAPSVRRVAHSCQSDRGGVAGPSEHPLSRSAAARASGAQVGRCDRPRVVCRSAGADSRHPLRLPGPACRRRPACRFPISGSSSGPDGWGSTIPALREPPPISLSLRWPAVAVWAPITFIPPISNRHAPSSIAIPGDLAHLPTMYSRTPSPLRSPPSRDPRASHPSSPGRRSRTSLRYERVERPSPGPGQALVRLEAVGVNFIEVYQRTGLYKVQPPFIPGSEAAGTVVEVGPGVTSVREGDRVASQNFAGSYAEFSAGAGGTTGEAAG